MTKLRLKKPRLLALILTLVSLVGILSMTTFVVLPNLTTSLSGLGNHITQLIDQVTVWFEQSSFVAPDIKTQIATYLETNGDKLGQISSRFLSGLSSNLGQAFSSLSTFGLGLVFMASILMSKEWLAKTVQRLMVAILPDKLVHQLNHLGQVTLTTYDKFLRSQLIEALIIGLLIWAGYSFAGLPYGGMTGILAGVLSFIPYVGPFMAGLLGAVFIFATSPFQALLSVVVFVGLQFIEANFIYPRVVVGSVGLPSLVTLAAATIGGSLFGLLGMVFFTPIVAVLYHLIKEWVAKKE